VRGAGLGCPSGAVRAAAGRVTDGHAVALAVSEAVTNVVIHAYRDRHHGLLGEVQVTATIDGEELLVSVADEEMGMRPRPDSPGAASGCRSSPRWPTASRCSSARAGTRLLLGFRLSPVSDRAS